MVKRSRVFLGLAMLTLVGGLAMACSGGNGETAPFLNNSTATTTPSPETNPGTPTAGAARAQASPTPAGGPIEYEIQPGDTLVAIAARFDTTVMAIVELNGIEDPALIFPGDVIRIPR